MDSKKKAEKELKASQKEVENKLKESLLKLRFAAKNLSKDGGTVGRSGTRERLSPVRMNRNGYFINSKLKSIRLINFKSFKDSGWIPFKKLTFLMGNNSAGKSSIIKAFQFLRQSIMNAEKSFILGSSSYAEVSLNINQYCNLGRFEDTVFDGENDFTIELLMEMKTIADLPTNNIIISFKYQAPDGNKNSHFASLTEFIIGAEKIGPLCIVDIHKDSIVFKTKALIKYGYNKTVIQAWFKKIIDYNIKTPRSKKRYTLAKHIKNNLFLKNTEKDINNILKNLNVNEFMKILEKVAPKIFNLGNQSDIELKLFGGKEGILFDVEEDSKPTYLRDYGAHDWLNNLFLASLTVSDENDFLITDNIKSISFLLKNEGLTEYGLLETFSVLPLIIHYLNPTSRGVDDYKLSLWFEEKLLATQLKVIDDAVLLILQDFLLLFGPTSFFNNLTRIITRSLQSFTRNQSYVEPLRGVASRYLSRHDPSTATDMWKNLLSDRESKRKIKYIEGFLSNMGIKHMSIKRSYFSDELVEPQLQDGTKNRNLKDFGFGFSQVIPILISCLDYLMLPDKNIVTGAKRPSANIIIEQPEIHLHPAAQALLADYFIQIVIDFGKMFIIETHSEHIILKTQLLVKENPEIAEDVQIIFVERKKLRGSNKLTSTIHSIDIKKSGKLSEPFPDDFFDISYKLFSQL